MEQDTRREKLNVSVLNEVDEREHFHQDIELIYVLEGSLNVEIGKQTTKMKEEDVLVINANKKHLLSASDDILYMQLMISYQLVSDIFQSIDVIFWCDSTKDENDRYDELRKVLRILLNHYLETHGNVANFGHIALCYRVMDILSMYFLVQTTDRENMDEKDKFEERLLQINNYIRANYNQPISLKDLADKLYLSNGYLSRFFKRNYGMSFAEYLTNIRLFHAVDDLLYTNASITRVAYDNGFASVAVFNKVFKKAYGETPSALRKKSKEQGEEVKEEQQNQEIEKRLEQYLLVNEDEEVYSEKEVCQKSYSARQSTDLPNYWGNTINIGVASELLRSEVQEHILLLKEALGFKYVRFWNIFSADLLIDLNVTDGSYNFARLDSILDFLLKLDLKPHMDLGMKSRMIVYNVQNMEFSDEREDNYLKKDFIEPEKWQKFISALMKHLSQRYGRSELDTWRVELWYNEGQWSEDRFDEYFRLFDILYKTIKDHSDKMEVGGCGLRYDFDRHTRETFLKQWNEQESRPDFLSAYVYNYDRGEIDEDRYSKRSTDEEFLLHHLMRERELIKKAGLDDAKLYITEWNLTASVRNYINDSCFKGAYIIKNILDVYGLVDDLGFYLGTDRTIEYYDSNELLFGGAGIISKDTVLKPAGFAFEFLGRLYPYFVGKGDNYLISTDRHDSFGIICHNKKALSYNYYFAKEDELEKEHLWKYFEGRDELELKLKLKDISEGMYQVKTYRINEKNGSVMEIWKELGFEKGLSRNDIKYFRRVCEPKLMIQKCQTQDGVLDLDISLMANEIAFIRIRKEH